MADRSASIASNQRASAAAGAADGADELDAELALARLAAWASGLRGGCLLDAQGRALAATGERERWEAAAQALLAAADAAAGEPVTQAHVGTEEGEVFAVRERGHALVAVSERFALASLMLFDIRSALRGLDAASVRTAEPPTAATGSR